MQQQQQQQQQWETTEVRVQVEAIGGDAVHGDQLRESRESENGRGRLLPVAGCGEREDAGAKLGGELQRRDWLDGCKLADNILVVLD